MTTNEEQDWEEINAKLAAYDTLKTKVRYWFDCEVAMMRGMLEGGQTLAAGAFDEMQETQRELMEMVGWEPTERREVRAGEGGAGDV